MKTINYDKYNETVHIENLDNGLSIHIMEKKEYVKSVVSMSIKYGSLDLFKDESTRTSTGIAHYLEHMLFNSIDGDISEEFYNKGAQVNAFTSYVQTCYYFHGTNEIEYLTNVLLNMVHNPTFDDSLVEKERSIIIEELKMYLDYPSTRIFNEVNNNLFIDHPFKYDIGGTIEDVEKITKEELVNVYKEYYRPSNMIFFYAGPIDKDIIINLVKEFYKGKTFDSYKVLKYFKKPIDYIIKKESFLEEERSISKNVIAYKIDSSMEKNRLRLLLNIYTSMAISETSYFYEDMLNKNIISNGFFINILTVESLAVVYIGANSNKSDDFFSEVINCLKTFKPSEEEFKKYVNKFYGSTMTLLNNLGNIMYDYNMALIDDSDLFSLTDLVTDLKVEELEEIKDMFKENFTKVVMR